ncbi:MAG: hypothetical protein R6X07_00340, partial [Desulfatiglandales bacterium]
MTVFMLVLLATVIMFVVVSVLVIAFHCLFSFPRMLLRSEYSRPDAFEEITDSPEKASEQTGFIHFRDGHHVSAGDRFVVKDNLDGSYFHALWDRRPEVF